MAEETASDTTDQRVSEIASSLVALLDVEDAKLAELHEQVREIDNRRGRIKRAIDALQKTEKAKATKTAKQSKAWDNWTPKPESMRQLERAIAEFGDQPFTVREAYEKAGLSDTLTRRALEILRDRGRLRRAGVRNGPGGGAALYATMPSAVAATRDR
jgi:response regulator of citrate/malate metabolism